MDKHPDWWSGVNPVSVPVLDEGWKQLYNDYIPIVANSDLSAVEIGCFPGGFIGELGKLGYRISGFDTHPQVVQLNYLFDGIPDVKNDQFYCESLDQHMERAFKYDLVMSMGFIEHFENWPDIFKKHSELCKVGGKIIIGAPNFASPVQRALHTVLDLGNIENHCLHAMYPLAWEGYMLALGFNVIYSGHYGGFNFWTESNPVVGGEALLAGLTKALVPHIRDLSKSFNARESGYSIIVASKDKEVSPDLDLERMANYFVRLSQMLSAKDLAKSKVLVESLRTLID